MKRYAVIGAGHRAGMYVEALLGRHRGDGELAAWVEPNPVRAAAFEQMATKVLGGQRPVYPPAELERALAREGVERVIVTSLDRAHADLVCRALRAGVDVVVEKPIAAQADQAREIAQAVEQTGRDVRLTFNYRYSPRNVALREVVAGGELGKITSVHFDWALDTMHGADYFRRWHRDKANSGGLLVHKSSHHFDLVNWWIGSTPERVFATGGRRFYGADAGHADGYTASATERSLRDRGIDPWFLDIAKDPWLWRLYGEEAQKADGYVRNRCVFDPGVNIEDTLGLVVEYVDGPVLTYSLVAYSPYEGYRVVINGTQGRAELTVVERGSVEVAADGTVVLDASSTKVVAGDPVRPSSERLVVQRHWERAEERQIVNTAGGHGGGDALLLADVFAPDGRTDRLGRAAGLADGLRASGVGYAGNQSLQSGLPVRLAELGLDLGRTGADRGESAERR
ncbi:MAG: Gfo/Idh/MocA family oxidoreductase [Bifidobacteriaceae bacterium]|jgi:predicted dehydrogenase|nr:Gfo/Idh/MocA family oxidoreductase [Bifidobacteriaceae bacterium]